MSEMAMMLAAAALLLAPAQLPRTARFAGYVAGRGTGVARRARAALDAIARESRLDALGEELRASVRDVERMRSEIRGEMQAVAADSPATRAREGAAVEKSSHDADNEAIRRRIGHHSDIGSIVGDSAGIVFRVRPQPERAASRASTEMKLLQQQQEQQQQERDVPAMRSRRTKKKKLLGVAPAAAIGKVGSVKLVTETVFAAGNGVENESGADILVRTIEEEGNASSASWLR